MDNDDENEVIKPDRPWMALENTLSGEDGESFSRAIEEAFPIEPVAKESNTLPLNHRQTVSRGDAENAGMKTLKAEYDDAAQSLRLLAPLEGFTDGEKVSVIVHHVDANRPWSDLRGSLSGEEGEKFARVIEEAFPIEPVKK